MFNRKGRNYGWPDNDSKNNEIIKRQGGRGRGVSAIKANDISQFRVRKDIIKTKNNTFILFFYK